LKRRAVRNDLRRGNGHAWYAPNPDAWPPATSASATSALTVARRNAEACGAASGTHRPAAPSSAYSSADPEAELCVRVAGGSAPFASQRPFCSLNDDRAG